MGQRSVVCVLKSRRGKRKHFNWLAIGATWKGLVVRYRKNTFLQRAWQLLFLGPLAHPLSSPGGVRGAAVAQTQKQ